MRDCSQVAALLAAVGALAFAAPQTSAPHGAWTRRRLASRAILSKAARTVEVVMSEAADGMRFSPDRVEVATRRAGPVRCPQLRDAQPRVLHRRRGREQASRGDDGRDARHEARRSEREDGCAGPVGDLALAVLAQGRVRVRLSRPRSLRGRDARDGDRQMTTHIAQLNIGRFRSTRSTIRAWPGSWTTSTASTRSPSGARASSGG